MPALVSRRPSGDPPLAPARVRRLAEGMLAALGLPQAELSLLLTDDATIHRLNRRHRDVDRPTDVLAFPLDGHGDSPGVVGAPAPILLGDIVISLETALRQARGRRRPLLHEVRFLLAHGLLHLIGYDHDTPLRKRRMSRLTRQLVRSVPLPGDSARALERSAPRAAAAHDAAGGARRGKSARTGSRGGSRKRLVKGPRGRP